MYKIEMKQYKNELEFRLPRFQTSILCSKQMLNSIQTISFETFQLKTHSKPKTSRY